MANAEAQAAGREPHPLPHFRIHGMRHTAATLLLHAGENPKVVQELLGHGNESTTMNIYAHALPGAGKEAADTMQSLPG